MPSSAQANLADQGVEIIKLVLELAKHGSSDAEVLRGKCEHLLNDFSARAQRAGYAHESIDAARYAFVALIDERILASNLPVRTAWLDNPLQLRLYDSFAAGEEFFTRMERFRAPRDAERADVLEVFHCCLALGFRGKLGDARGEPPRSQLLEQAASEVLTARGGLAGELSPAWQGGGMPLTGADPRRWKGIPVWVIALAAIGFAALVWLLSHLWVAAAVSDAVRDLGAR
jgi:type VI secretion system protein ImpK